MRVVGVAGISYDLVLKVDQFPTVDSKTHSQFMGQVPGGFIANATTAMAQLGLNTGYVGWVGNDDAGHMLRDAFVDHGVDVQALRLADDETTPFTVILLNSEGERIILLPQFPLYQQPLDDAQLNYLRTSGMIYTYPENLTWCKTLYDCVQPVQGHLVLDIEYGSHFERTELQQMIMMTTICFVSDAVMAKLGVDSIEQIETSGWVIRTLGARGAEGYSQATGLVFEPARKVDVVDTTGAGDCFHGATVAAYLWGRDLQQALQFASVATSLKIQHLGARNGQPTREQVEAVL